MTACVTTYEPRGPYVEEALKSFIKSGCKSLTAAEVKEVETALVALRNEKVKSEKAEATAAAKAKTEATKGKKGKKFLNTGTKGGDSGLEDYKYSNYSVDDDYDFM